MRRPRYVLDASALVALARTKPEPGAARVLEAIRAGAAISTVNYSEAVLEIAGQRSLRPDDADEEIRASVPELRVRLFTRRQALDAARIERFTRGTAIGLADRACMALGRSLRARILTADGAWVAVRERHPKLLVSIENIRTP